jgi:hypothetical protein
MPSMVFTKFGTRVGQKKKRRTEEIEGTKREIRDTQLGTEQHYRSF